MPQTRKTRQQKIELSQRKSQRLGTSQYDALISPTVDGADSAAAGAVAVSVQNQDVLKSTSDYVAIELRRIGWISLLCFGLLLIASLFLSEAAWITGIRDSLHIPYIVIFR